MIFKTLTPEEAEAWMQEHAYDYEPSPEEMGEIKPVEQTVPESIPTPPPLDEEIPF